MLGAIPFSGKRKARFETQIGRWRMMGIGLEGLVELPQPTSRFRFQAAVLPDLQFVGQASPGQLSADVMWRRAEALAPYMSKFMEAETVQSGDLGLKRFFLI